MSLNTSKVQVDDDASLNEAVREMLEEAATRATTDVRLFGNHAREKALVMLSLDQHCSPSIHSLAIASIDQHKAVPDHLVLTIVRAFFQNDWSEGSTGGPFGFTRHFTATAKAPGELVAV